MRYLIYKLFSKLFLIAFNYKNSELKRFIVNEIKSNARDFSDTYNEYRRRYSLSPSFRFNGLSILLYGEGKIETGTNSYVGEYSTLYSHKGRVLRIGDGVRIGHNVRIYTLSNVADQDFSRTELLEKEGDVIIEDYVWIGANVLINPGVKIGKNSVIGANSVVTKDVPANSICGGVPLKLIRMKEHSI